MMAKDRDALICDLAAEYGILDIKGLPVSTLATLSVGLRDDSRIKRKMSGIDLALNDQLLAVVADRLGHLIWMLGKDSNTENHPESILEALLGDGDSKTSQAVSFESPDQYEEAWTRITGVKHGS